MAHEMTSLILPASEFIHQTIQVRLSFGVSLLRTLQCRFASRFQGLPVGVPLCQYRRDCLGEIAVPGDRDTCMRKVVGNAAAVIRYDRHAMPHCLEKDQRLRFVSIAGGEYKHVNIIIKLVLIAVRDRTPVFEILKKLRLRLSQQMLGVGRGRWSRHYQPGLNANAVKMAKQFNRGVESLLG